MIRREFLLKSGMVGGALLTPLIGTATKPSASNFCKSGFYNEQRQKVKMAMLSMQKQNWEHGIASQAFVEIGDTQMMILLAKEAAVRQSSDGRLAVMSVANGIGDSATPIEALLKSAKILNDKDLTDAVDRMIEYYFNDAPRTKEGYVHHSYHGPELWSDTMYMGPPFIAYAGYPEEGLFQLLGIREKLYNKTHSLFHNRWNEESGGLRDDSFWGLGNAHAITGMVKLMENLPEKMSDEKEMLIEYIYDHLNGCLQHIREDYLFHNHLDDKSTFVESSLSERLAYIIFKGINEKWLDAKYKDIALNMRNAVSKQVDQFGYVNGIPGPPSYSQPNRSTEGQAFYLMMEAQYDKIKNA
ncbi:glycoside hydrolase family 88 protein [Marinilabiliaceae bacterium ANBcel2]|nr:glycoside hydrolase family 88 protein [Marinilabiliaceae bacterium ANBcel2]